MPGALSGTIGIVGGLIIGDAAVSANLVSPMAVVGCGTERTQFLCHYRMRNVPRHSG